MGCQGQSVLHNAQELHEFAGAIAEIAKGDGNFVRSSESNQTDGGIPERSQVLGSMPLFHLAFVFAKGNVPHPMQPVLYAPVTTPGLEQQGRFGPLGRDTGNGELNLGCLAAFAMGDAFQATRLLQTRPTEMPRQSRAGLKMPLDSAAMPF